MRKFLFYFLSFFRHKRKRNGKQRRKKIRISRSLHSIFLFNKRREKRKNDCFSSFFHFRYGRDIAKACRTDIRFIWLLNGEPAPSHATISRFQDERLKEVMEGLFYQFVEKLYEMKEIEFKNLFVDGTKIEANANRYTFVWKKSRRKES